MSADAVPRPYDVLADQPQRRWRRYFQEVWRFRELVLNLVSRDLKARYKSSVLGFLWSFANPVLMMAVFTIVFTALLPNREMPNFPVFVLSGLLAWNWCSASTLGGVYSITANAHLVKKVAFPRELLPLSVVLSNGVNFLLALLPLLLLSIAFGLWPTPLYLLLPVVIVIQILFLTGLALFLGCLNVYFRDTEAIMDVVVMAWFFLTPVVYAVEHLSPQNARVIYWLNPMASIISTYRLIFYYQAPPAPDFVLRMAVQAILVFVVGYLFFLRHAPDFGESV